MSETKRYNRRGEEIFTGDPAKGTYGFICNEPRECDSCSNIVPVGGEMYEDLVRVCGECAAALDVEQPLVWAVNFRMVIQVHADSPEEALSRAQEMAEFIDLGADFDCGGFAVVDHAIVPATLDDVTFVEED